MWPGRVFAPAVLTHRLKGIFICWFLNWGMFDANTNTIFIMFIEISDVSICVLELSRTSNQIIIHVPKDNCIRFPNRLAIYVYISVTRRDTCLRVTLSTLHYQYYYIVVWQRFLHALCKTNRTKSIDLQHIRIHNKGLGLICYNYNYYGFVWNHHPSTLGASRPR